MDIGLHIMLHCSVWAEQREKILKMIEIRRNYEAVIGGLNKKLGDLRRILRDRNEEKGEERKRASM